MNSNDSAPTVEGRHASIWLATTPETAYEALDDGVNVDTVVVGSGIVGITTASRLAEAGQAVALVDRDRILTGVTGHTTAKLTSLHGLVYDYLLDQFDEERAQQYADANETAIDEIEATVEERGIDCDFERVPAYTYTASEDGRQAVRDEVDAARRLGLPASYTESTALPYDVEAAVCFENQAHFHPRKYLLSLARDFAESGGYVFEDTRALDVEPGDPCRVSTEHGELVADDVVVATNFPFFDEGFYFARLEPKRSYVLAARLADEPPTGMYYRSGDPYFSVRPHPAGDESLVLFGGQNHKTGHEENGVDRYRNVEREARSRFDVESVEYRWSTQDYRSVDRVPFVGKLAPHTGNVHVATGFGGWGLTNGTAAGMILSDSILDRENPWAPVYEPTRFNVTASTRELLEHNTAAMKHFFGDRLAQRPGGVSVDVDRGDATVVDSDDGPVGVYRDDSGSLHVVSVVCPHMHCHVEWNDGERSWDCPCHGSRFDYDGSVVHTPAVEDLQTYSEQELSSIGVGVSREQSADQDD